MAISPPRHLPAASIGLSLILAVFVCPATAAAIEYGGIGGRPAYPRPGEPRTDSIFIHEISPGQVIDEGITVINNTQSTKTLSVYAADSTPSTDGGFACKQMAETSTGVGSWIKLDKTSVTLDPVSSHLVPFTITVPDDVEIGEYNGCILIQEQKNASVSGPGINLSTRTGIRVALTVPGELVKSLTLSDFSLIRHTGRRAVLRPTVTSQSNVSVPVDVMVVVRNLFGREVKRFNGTYSVLRGDKSVWNFEFIPSEWGGYYTSQAFVNYHNGSTDIRLTSPVLRFIYLPSLRVILFLFLGLLPVPVILFVLRRRRRPPSRRRKGQSWQYYQTLPGDTLQSVADMYGVSVRELAKINRFSSSHVIKPGTGLKVPPQKSKKQEE